MTVLSPSRSVPILRSARALGPRRADLRLVEEVRLRAQLCELASTADLQRATEQLFERVCRSGDVHHREVLVPAMALMTEAVRRTQNKVYYDVQLLGGLTLAGGAIAEIQTGEGKTLTAALPAFLHALTGRGVHVATTNSYLAQRDFEVLRPAFELLGMSVGFVSMEMDPQLKREAYRCDVTYATGYDFGFDFLRDQLALRSGVQPRLGTRYLHRLRGHAVRRRQLLQRPPVFAIIDEADSVLIDEATTPLILSGASAGGAVDPQPYNLARQVAGTLNRDVDDHVDAQARISRQRYFQFYEGICGLTGTARGVEPEFHSFYRRPVVLIPRNKPSRRKQLRTRCFNTEDHKRTAIIESAIDRHTHGQPVLIGTHTILESRHLSRLLSKQRVAHQVLNGIQDEAEAELVAGAGQGRAISIATNMAGRGTDIKLDTAAKTAGGLHVIVSEHHPSRRIDRQLIGRCARQDDPGSCQSFVSAEDEIIQHDPRLVQRMRSIAARSGECAADYTQAVEQIQDQLERDAFTRRMGMVQSNHWMENVLDAPARRA